MIKLLCTGLFFIVFSTLSPQARSSEGWRSSVSLSEQSGVLQGARLDAKLIKTPVNQFGLSSAVSLGFVYDQSTFDYNLSQIYSAWESYNWKVTFGRKKKKWSQIDGEWRLGLWEPRYRFNYLRPQSQGLTGVFLEGGRRQLKWTLFLSSVFIPDYGPTVRESEGNLESGNPWFRSPSETFQFGTEVSGIRYHIKQPKLERLLQKVSRGALVEIGRRYGWWLRGAYSVKPANQLLLSYRARLKIASEPYGDVRLIPRSFQQEVVSGDFGYRSKKFSISTSYIQERTVSSEFLKGFANQFYTPSRGYSLKIALKRRAWTGSLSFLDLIGGESSEIGETLSDQSVFPGRFDYHKGVKLSLSRFYDRTLFKLSWLRAIEQKGSIFTADWSYMWRSQWSIFAGLESLIANSEEGFIYTYRGNDRVFTGMTYVF